MTERFLRAQLNILKPYITGSTLESVRKSQDLVGELMTFSSKSSVNFVPKKFDDFDAEWIIPKNDTPGGVILYLHGGGYTCGSLDYAKGFGSKLAATYGLKVLCVAYRLAPENRFPCAVDDALTAYRFLLSEGFTADRIVLAGESSGGGLCFSLCIKLSQLGIDRPAGIIAVSPWTDLTSSGESYEQNKDNDPSMTKERLQFFAECYTDDKSNPLASPLFFEDMRFPPSRFFLGGDLKNIY